jgi:capsular polysaccharide biosynthesis protein
MLTDHFKSRSLRYATVVTRWVAIASLIFAATMSAGIYFTNHVLEKVYSATAAMEIGPKPASAEAYSGWAFSSPQSRAIKAEFESIESPDILKAVISGLGLEKTWAERVFNRSEPLSSDEALHYLKSNLHLNYKHNSNTVEVTAMSDDPKEAAQIANQVVNLYKLASDAKAGAPGGARPTPVRITTPAVVPFEPTRPDKRFCYAVTAALGGMLGVMLASSVEVCLLIARAENAANELSAGR